MGDLKKRMVFLIGTLIFLLGGCWNLFSGLEKPRGDEQLLEWARQCFDEKDYSCAIRYYNALSGAYSDTKHYELALLELDQAGFSLDALLEKAGTDFSQGGGLILTHIAGLMSPQAGQTLRLNLLQTYQRYFWIQDPELRFFIRFLSSLVLASEILAEASHPRSTLLKSDLVADVSGCLNANVFTLTTACVAPGGTALTAGTGSLTITASSPSSVLSGGATLVMLRFFLTEANTALQSISFLQSSLSAATLQVTQAILDVINPASGPTFEAIFRQALIKEGGIGE